MATEPQAKKKHPGGRPATYSIELGRAICDVIETSELSVYDICKTRSDFPHPDTFFSWLAKYPELSELYLKAKERQAEVLVEDMLRVAREKSDDSVSAADKKMLLDLLKWNAARRKPRQYGDRVIVEDTSGKEEVIKSTQKKLEKVLQKRKKV